MKAGTQRWKTKTVGTLLLLLAVPALAQTQYTWTTNNGSITITRYSANPGGPITIPGTIDGLPVTSIGTNAFANSDFTSVTIPASVTNLGAYAFANDYDLTGVYFQGDAPAAAPTAFLGDYSAVFYLLGLKYVSGNGAFVVTGCTGSISNVTIPDTFLGQPVAAIGTEAFVNCNSMTNVTMGPNILSIGSEAFDGCTRLSRVTIPGSVTNIGDGAFQNCSRLTAITVDPANSFYSSTNGVLFDRSQATLIEYPAGLGGSYTVPEDVTSIAVTAFQNCIGLSGITLPASITNISSGTFIGCSGLTAIIVDPANSFYSSTNGVLFDRSQTTLIEYPAGLGGSYTIPDSVTSLGQSAFQGCASLSGVTMGDSVTDIGGDAFYDCTSLSNAPIGPNVTSIGGAAFQNCASLSSVVIPDSVTNMGYQAFALCSGLTNVVIGNGVTSIEFGTFIFCTRLAAVTIGSSVVSIGSGAFQGCTSLASITIPASVTGFGLYALNACASLTSIYFQGDAPGVDSTVFNYNGNVTAYYLAGTMGWSDFANESGIPVALWLPQIEASRDSFGVRTNQFEFNVNWAGSRSVVVEACTDLSNPVWLPLQTNFLANGSALFNDALSTNYPARFYRVRSP